MTTLLTCRFGAQVRRGVLPWNLYVCIHIYTYIYIYDYAIGLRFVDRYGEGFYPGTYIYAYICIHIYTYMYMITLLT